MFSAPQRPGFTLVELIIVVVVIAILATIVTLSTRLYLANARDSKREANIEVIMAAAEQYYEKNGEYPYNTGLNPTGTMGKLPNYDAVRAHMPSLSDDKLTDSSGYNFWAIGCQNCSSTADQLKERGTQYIYFSAFINTSTSYIQYPYSTANPQLWGCRVEVSNVDPGFMIAWRSESSGLWTFKRSLRGQVTISDYGSTRAPGQMCAWS